MLLTQEILFTEKAKSDLEKQKNSYKEKCHQKTEKNTQFKGGDFHENVSH